MVLFVGFALARTWIVDPSGGGDAVTIAGALGLAAAGDEIHVRAGEYAESLVVSRAVVLKGVDGASATVIRSPRSAPTLRVTAAATIEGLTLTRSGASAVRIDGDAPTFTDVVVSDSGDLGSSEGAAVLVMAGTPTFEGVSFRNNVGYYGAHLYVGPDAVVTVSSSTLEGGGAIQGGAAFVDPDGELVLTDSILRDNESLRSGGAIQIQGAGRLTMTDTDLEGNVTTGAGGAAIGVVGTATLVLTGGSVRGNVPVDWAADGYPGAFYLNDATLTLTDIEISENAGASGGGIYAVDASLELSGVTVRDNQATSGGGAWLYETVLTDYASDWNGNLATTAAGGIYASLTTLSLDAVGMAGNQAGTDGGGLYLDASTVEFANGALDGNVAADQGGGGYSQGSVVHLDRVRVADNRAWVGGGWAGASDTSFQTEGLDLQDNEAELGGGLALEDTPTWSDLGSRWTGNAASDSGGAAWTSGVVVLLDGPEIADSVALFGDGGSLAAVGGSLTVTGASFDQGLAAWDGGHVYASGAPLVVQDARFERGVSVYGDGGGVWADAGAEGLRVRFGGNQAGRGAALAQIGGVDGDRWENVAFIENLGSAVLLRTHPGFDLLQADVLGNPVGIEGTSSSVDARDVLFGWNDLAVSLVGGEFTGGWNAWWANGADVGGDVSIVPGEGNLAADPRLVAFALDGDPSSDVLVPLADSPLLDAGDPSLVDPDGSRADVGVTGGPSAGWEDLDGDGSPSGLDCDDAQADVYPGAPESAYDGIDHDCDGLDLDLDGDGHDAADQGGDDCDDADPTTWEACDEDSAVDSGGDSADTGVQEEPKVEVAPCGCAVRFPAVSGLLLVGAWLGGRRRPARG